MVSASSVRASRTALWSSLEGQPERANEAFAVGGEEVVVHAGPVVEAVEVGLGGELDEVAPAGFRFGRGG